MDKKLVIVGDGPFAEIAAEYFRDEGREVVCFAVEAAFREKSNLRGIPVVDMEGMEKIFAPSSHDVFVACAYGKMNSLRTRLLRRAMSLGYEPASYVSPRAFVHRTVKLGRHCFVFEDNTIQPFVELGDNNVLWSGNHVGHHSRIGSNNFISSHVVISGFCNVGDNCFMGVNATLANNLDIGSLSWIGMGASVTKSLAPKSMIKGIRGEISAVDSLQFWKMTQEDVLS